MTHHMLFLNNSRSILVLTQFSKSSLEKLNNSSRLYGGVKYVVELDFNQGLCRLAVIWWSQGPATFKLGNRGQAKHLLT